MTLPNGWAEATIGDLVEPTETDDPKKNPDQPFRYVDIGSIDNSTLQIVEPKTIIGREAPSRARRRIRMGDVLFSTVRPYLKNIAMVPPELDGEFTSTGICVLRAGGAADPEYIFRRVISPDFIDSMTLASDGTMYPAIADRDVLSASIALPPLAEQRRIVAKLDALTARLARARTELDRVPVLAHSFRLQAIQTAFAPSVGAPAHRIDSLCSVGTGATPKRGEGRYYRGGTISWVTSGVVNSGTVSEPTDLITQVAIKETNCKVYPAGSLIVALYGEGKTRGKVATLGIDAATNQALAVLHSFDRARVEPDWIRLFLEARYEETRAEAAGGVQPNLNLGTVKAIQLPLPALDVQRAAIAQINAAFARADRLEAEAARARALLDRLEAAILTRAFRGELVPQDPADEPATALLARIRAQRAAAPKPKRGRKKKDTADA